MRVLGVIPARGGSKGILDKNIIPVLGRPLLAYTAEAALSARLLTSVVVSTDNEKIATCARQLGLSVPFLRPAYLAQDDTPTLPVIEHALDFMQTQGQEFDAVCVLQPTNPLRNAQDIDSAITLLNHTQADSVISFVDVGERHPARMKYVEHETKRVIDPPFKELQEGQRRQTLQKIYLRDGSIYLTYIHALKTYRSFQGQDCRALIMPKERAWNIDEPFDVGIVEYLLHLQYTSF